MADDFDYDAQRELAAHDAQLLTLDEVLAFLGCESDRLQADIDQGWAPKPYYLADGHKPNGKINWVKRWRRGELERSRAGGVATRGALP